MEVKMNRNRNMKMKSSMNNMKKILFFITLITMPSLGFSGDKQEAKANKTDMEDIEGISDKVSPWGCIEDFYSKYDFIPDYDLVPDFDPCPVNLDLELDLEPCRPEEREFLEEEEFLTENEDNERVKIKKLCWFLVEQGFVSEDHLCHKALSDYDYGDNGNGDGYGYGIEGEILIDELLNRDILYMIQVLGASSSC